MYSTGRKIKRLPQEIEAGNLVKIMKQHKVGWVPEMIKYIGMTGIVTETDGYYAKVQVIFHNPDGSTHLQMNGGYNYQISCLRLIMK